MANEHVHQWAVQWNRKACIVSDCSTFKTLDLGIEYEDPSGRLDPYEIEANAQPKEPETPVETDPRSTVEYANPKPGKRAKTEALNPDPNLDDLVANLDNQEG